MYALNKLEASLLFCINIAHSVHVRYTSAALEQERYSIAWDQLFKLNERQISLIKKFPIQSIDERVNE